MSLQDVVEVWRNHVRNQGMVRMMGHLPDVMEDLAVDSKSRIVICNECQGEGRLNEKEINKMTHPICPVCHGDGKVRLLGDKDARTLMFETAGLKKGGGTQVNVMQLNAGGVPSIEDQIASVDKIFDAETIEEEDDNADNGQEGLPEAEETDEQDRGSAAETAADSDPVADADARWDAIAESSDPTNDSG